MTDGFMLLLRAHDHVWLDRQLPLRVRTETCQLLWGLALQLCGGGSAWIAPALDSLGGTVLAPDAEARR